MRVYLPSTLTRLVRVLAEGEIGPAPLPGHAVTPALREWYAGGDTEELEYAAMAAAARASLRLIPEDGAPPRRVVLAVEVPEQAVRRAGAEDDDRALVLVNAPVLIRDIAAGHVDDEDAEADVRAAVEALPAADKGDADAAFTVDGAEGHELLWYATQELADLT